MKGLRTCVRDGVCHLSGVENQAQKLWKDTGDRGQVSAFVLSFIGKTLRQMTEQLQEKIRSRYGYLPVVYAGGVMSNRLIRPLLSEKTSWKTYFSEPSFSADNAAGVSILCARKYLEQASSCE
jgi:N6-L-threonylcarbamoyladenine synthase